MECPRCRNRNYRHVGGDVFECVARVVVGGGPHPGHPLGVPIFGPHRYRFTRVEGERARAETLERAREEEARRRLEQSPEAIEARRLRAEEERRRRVEHERQQAEERAAREAEELRDHRIEWLIPAAFFLVAGVVVYAVVGANGGDGVGKLAAGGAVAGPGFYCVFTALHDRPWRATWEWLGILPMFGAIGAVAGVVLGLLLT